MGGDSSKKMKSRERDIAADEARLWAEITGEVEPLDEEHKKLVLKPSPLATDLGKGAVPRRRVPDAGSGPTETGKPDNARKTSSGQVVQQVFDRRKMRKIGAGQIAIDGRIDLHGMRQSEAFIALNSFLLNAQAQHYRLILVITGKGRIKTEISENWMDDREAGVLRREVPNWLSSGDLAHVVLGYSTALAKHGGEGALYVRLRRLKT